jgi:asparagine synthetase B (glutamine-hydrolysing)
MGYPVYRNLSQFITEASERWASVKNMAGKISVEIEENLNLLKTKKEEALYSLMIKSQLPWFQLNPVDKCSMRFGVELRVPYLSTIHALPASKYKIKDHLSGDIEKNILRSAFKFTKLPTIFRKKYFAGTRTLPSFYQELDHLAEKELSNLKKTYPNESKILNTKDLYALSLLDAEMRKNSNKTIEKLSINK